MLHTGDALDHDGYPYCKAHYMKNFGPKGMIQGVTMDTGIGNAEGVIESGGREFSDPLTQKKEVKRTAATDSLVVDGSEAQIAAERNRHALRAAEEALNVDDDEDISARVESMRFQDPATVSSLSGAKGKSYAAKKFDLGGGDNCRACGKTVGFADKITAMGGKWHKSCFSCQYCSKTFPTAADAIEANGKPCCKPCFQKNHPSSRKY